MGIIVVAFITFNWVFILTNASALIPYGYVSYRELTSDLLIGPLHDPITWYNITHDGRKLCNGTSKSKLKVPLCNLSPNMWDFVTFDRIVQREY